MKFSQIADGQQFEYQGTLYTRQGPLMGVDTKGMSKMIPRSAEVKTMTVGSAEPETRPDPVISVEQTEHVLDGFCALLTDCLDKTAADADSIKTTNIQKCIAQSRLAYMKTLKA